MLAPEPVTGVMDVAEHADQSKPQAPRQTKLAEPSAEMDRDQLRERAIELDQRAADLRSRIYTLTDTRAKARGDVAAAITALQQRIPRPTPEAKMPGRS
jgi:hypothetical protein